MVAPIRARYGQIIDWFWKLDDFRQTSDFSDQFGDSSAEFSGLLVLGRDAFLSDQEKKRLDWRRKNVVVNSQYIYCCTYDELYRDVFDLLSIAQIAGLQEA
jgi:hypothetical protein